MFIRNFYFSTNYAKNIISEWDGDERVIGALRIQKLFDNNIKMMELENNYEQRN